MTISNLIVVRRPWDIAQNTFSWRGGSSRVSDVNKIGKSNIFKNGLKRFPFWPTGGHPKSRALILSIAAGTRKEECFEWRDDDYDDQYDDKKDYSSDIDRSFSPSSTSFANNPDYAVIRRNSKWMTKREFIYELKNIEGIDVSGKVKVDFANQVRSLIFVN